MRESTSSSKESNMPGRLNEKVALVTGSDSGIGQATAQAFGGEGADVVVSYLEDDEGAFRTRAAVEAAGGRGLVVQCDIRDESAVEARFLTRSPGAAPSGDSRTLSSLGPT